MQKSNMSIPRSWSSFAVCGSIRFQLLFMMTLKGRHSGVMPMTSGFCSFTTFQNSCLCWWFSKCHPETRSKLGGSVVVKLSGSSVAAAQIRGGEKSSHTLMGLRSSMAATWKELSLQGLLSPRGLTVPARTCDSLKTSFSLYFLRGVLASPPPVLGVLASPPRYFTFSWGPCVLPALLSSVSWGLGVPSALLPVSWSPSVSAARCDKMSRCTCLEKLEFKKSPPAWMDFFWELVRKTHDHPWQPSDWWQNNNQHFSK